MSGWDGVTALALVALVVGCWAAVFFGIPAVGHSLFRYRLWRLRDGLFDDVLYGRMPRHPAVMEVIHHIEESIRFSTHLTAVNLVLALLLNRSRGRKLPVHSDRSDLSLTEQQHLKEYDRAFAEALITHLLWTPSGWVAALLFPFVRLYRRLTRDRRGPEVRLVHRMADASLFGGFLKPDTADEKTPIGTYV